MREFISFWKKEFPHSCKYIPWFFVGACAFLDWVMLLFAGIALAGLSMNALVMWKNGRKMPVRVISEGFRTAIKERSGYCEMTKDTKYRWLADIILVRRKNRSSLYSIGDAVIFIGVYGWAYAFAMALGRLLRQICF